MDIFLGYLVSPIAEIEEEIERAKRLNFDFIEFSIEGPLLTIEYYKRNIKKIKSLIKDFKRKPIVHTVPWIDFTPAFQSVKNAWINELKKAIEISNELEADKFNIHFMFKGMYHKKEKFLKEFIDSFSQCLNILSDYAEKYRIKLMLENSPMRDTGRFDYYSKTINNSKAFVHLDIGHAYIVGGIREIKKYIENFGSKIIHIHVHDNKGSQDDHLPIGCGNINYKDVINMLKKINYKDTITLEVFVNDEDYIKLSKEKVINLFKK